MSIQKFLLQKSKSNSSVYSIRRPIYKVFNKKFWAQFETMKISPLIKLLQYIPGKHHLHINCIFLSLIYFITRTKILLASFTH